MHAAVLSTNSECENLFMNYLLVTAFYLIFENECVFKFQFRLLSLYFHTIMVYYSDRLAKVVCQGEASFLPAIFSGEKSVVMLIFLLFWDQISGGKSQRRANCLRGHPLLPPVEKSRTRGVQQHIHNMSSNGQIGYRCQHYII